MSDKPSSSRNDSLPEITPNIIRPWLEDLENYGKGIAQWTLTREHFEALCRYALAQSESGESVPSVYVQGSAELSQLVELKKIKRLIEAGTATDEQKRHYEAAKECAWRDAERAIEAIREYTTARIK